MLQPDENDFGWLFSDFPFYLPCTYLPSFQLSVQTPIKRLPIRKLLLSGNMYFQVYFRSRNVPTKGKPCSKSLNILLWISPAIILHTQVRRREWPMLCTWVPLAYPYLEPMYSKCRIDIKQNRKVHGSLNFMLHNHLWVKN